MKKLFGEALAYLRQMDKLMLLLIIALPVFGTVMVYSATLWTGNNFKATVTQVAAILIGFTCAVALSKIDYHALASLWKPIAVVSIGLLGLVLIIGKGGNSQETQKLWISLPLVGSIQPSEIVKVAFIITFAKHCDLVKDEISSFKNVVLLTLHAMIPIGLIALEHDMGMMSVFLFMFVCMMFAANLKLRYFAGGGIALLAASPLIWKYMPSKVQQRIEVLFNPSAYSQTIGYQQLHGVSALASGEVWGWGLFNGPTTQSTYKSALTERQNDMIFSVIGEELGFVGCVLLIIALAILMIRILMIARKSKDLLGSILCIGVFSTFAFQTIANIGMNLMLSPVIGITLPFISSGGSSIVSCFLAVGLVLSVYMNRSSDFLFANQNDQ